MRKFAEIFSKFHMKSKKSMLCAGTALVILATVLIMNMLPFGKMEALAKKGVITGSASVGDRFWSGMSIPRDLVLSQKLTVSNNTPSISQTYYGSDDYNSNDNYDSSRQQHFEYEYTDSFSREGVFQPSISVGIYNSHTGVGADNKWTDFSNIQRYYEYVTTSAKSTTTYYRVSMDDSTTVDMGETLFNYYRGYYKAPSGKVKSDDMIITTEEQLGKTFDTLLENCATLNKWIKYTGSGISLYQNGNKVKKIDMLTVTPVDFYYAVYNEDGSNRKFNDFDVLLYTYHTYTFNYDPDLTNLRKPQVSMVSGTNIHNAISKDDKIVLSSTNPTNSTQLQYCLNDSTGLSESEIKWTDYTTPFSPGGKEYLYVRSFYKDPNKQYVESGIDEYSLTYMKNTSAALESTPQNGANVDVGDTIQLSAKNASSDASIFYVVDKATKPQIFVVPYDQLAGLDLDGASKGEDYALVNGTYYIKINDIWYYSNDADIQKYDESNPIQTTETLRKRNNITIHALIADNGKEVGAFQSLTFAYSASVPTEAPVASITTSSSEPATIQMGTSISFVSSTPGSRIFYTTNGSAPVINVTATGGPSAGANTYEYTDSTPLVVNESIASYGKNFLVMAQAVTYTEYDGIYYRTYQDSSVVKFNYKIGEQAPVDAVKSIPATTTESPKEVSVGSRIQLYSDTTGVEIFYTTDGSEPQFDENTHEPVAGTSTEKYSVAKGVIVEPSSDSSLFTITAVAYKDGLATSDISRMVFAYPGAVSTPYANPASGAVTEGTEVLLSTSTKGAVIYYEIAVGNKTPENPNISSKVFDAENPIKIMQKTNIKAYAVKDSMESPVSSFEYTVSTKLKTPTPSVDTGSVIAAGTVVSLSGDTGATIYYTTDGSNPKDPKNNKVQVGNSVVINGKSGDLVVIRTYSKKDGYSDSDEGSYSYSISSYEGGIYADRESGEIVKNGETITLHTDLSDAKIYYTTDGSTPSEDSHSGNIVTIYGEPGETITVMALAIADGSEKSNAVATFTYTIMNKLAAPTSSVPDGAIFVKESMVELKAESGKIYYTLDGTDPSTSSNLYKKSIVIDKSVTIKAMAVAEDLEQSDISTFTYGFAEQVAAPIASYASGELEMGTKVTFTSATEGATIYYRTDGKDINLSRKNELEIYKEPITINQATNFKVIAVKDKMQDSNVLKVGYTVKEPVVIEAVDKEEALRVDNQSNRLQSRRSFSDTESGPSYKDVVLRNASYGAIVAAEEGSLPDQVQLVVEAANVTEAVNRRVKQVISDSFGVVASYDVTLLVNGEETQPEGTIEIGLPIPVEYENAMIHIVHVAEDGNIELFETRRSGGVAYAKVDHLSVFSITAPVEFAEEASTFPWLPVMYTLAVGLTGIGIWLIYKAKKQRREEGMQDV